MDGKNIKIVSVIIAAITAIIAFLALMFDEGVFWRFFLKNEDQVTPSATPYSTSAANEVANSNASDDGGDEVMPPVVQPDTTDTVVIPETATDGSQIIPIETIQTNTTSSGLSFIISDCQYFYDDFYYQIPDSDSFQSYSFVEFKQGISGHFNYSRELTNQEHDNWGHGGKILDKNGIECSVDASFYSNSDGIFAVELPENMPKGNYIYILYQFINDEYCEARIPFTVN